jgi:hypothetical protein
VTDESAIENLRTAVNTLQPFGDAMCPMDTGLTVLAIFIRGNRQVGIEIDLSGCQFVSSRAKRGWDGPSFPIQTQVRELLAGS